MQSLGFGRAMSSKQLNTEMFPQKCPVCEKSYTDPVILRCLHTICRNCADEGVPCNVCDERYTENGRNGAGFPEDLLITNITAINNAIRVYKENDERMLCKSCCLIPISNATNFCVECKVFICNFDTTAHVRFGSGKHNFIKLSALLSSPLSELIPINPFIHCPNHPSTHVEYICTQCDQLMCEDCSKLYHNDHTLQPSGSFIVEQSKMIEQKAKSLESKFSNRYEEEYEKQTRNLEIQKNRLLSSVERDFEFLIEKMTERKNNLVYSIISQHDERIKLLQAVYESNQMLNEKTKECLDKIKEYTVTYPTKYILPLALTLTHRLDELEFHDPDLDFDISKVEYNVKGLFELMNQFDKIGEIDAIRTPKFNNPIVTYPKEMLKSEWINSDNDSTDLTLITSAVTVHNYLIVVFKVETCETISVSSPTLTPESNFRITIFDPYSPTISHFSPKTLDVKSVSHMCTHKNGRTYLVDRVSKQLVKIDDMLDIEYTVSHNTQSQLLEDPVCISFDKTNANLLVYNQLTSIVNVFDMSLSFLSNIDITVPVSTRLTRSSSEVQRQAPLSPRPRSRPSVNAFFPPDMNSSFNECSKPNSINLAVNSKETVFFVPNTKQTLYVLDNDGKVLNEICLKEAPIEDSGANTTLSKQNSQDKKSLNQGSMNTRSRRRSNSNPKRSDHPISPRETKNYTTFVCINANDTVFIHQNDEVFIFNSELELVTQQPVPESYCPKSMNVDFFGHIFYTTNESILLC